MPIRAPARYPKLLQSRFQYGIQRLPTTRIYPRSTRNSSNNTSLTKRRVAIFPPHSETKSAAATKPRALARLPTSSVLRSLILGALFSPPILFAPGFALLKKISASPSRILNPDTNPILRAIVKPLVYDQFCAGTNRAEIQARITQIKALGFSGIILCYGKEVQIEKPSQPRVDHLNEEAHAFDEELELWKRGNLETLDMIGDGDFLGIKYTGAGKSITNDLLQGNDPPETFTESMDAILQKATAQNCRVWIDAEQQILQHTIDRWTIDLMRKYNRHGKAVLYTTLQAYLKKSRDKLSQQLQLAHREGWTLAIKLVRGAYINNDLRDRIHDTKAQTDESYDGIVRDLLSGTVKGVPAAQDFPKMQLFIAGHNATSVAAASKLIRDLGEQGKLRILPEFGQLQGMADELGCELLQRGEEEDAAAAAAARALGGSGTAGIPLAKVPRVYKCLTWGSVQECMQFLVRRAVENHGATGAVKDGMPALARELRRRVIDALMRRRRTEVKLG